MVNLLHFNTLVQPNSNQACTAKTFKLSLQYILLVRKILRTNMNSSSERKRSAATCRSLPRAEEAITGAAQALAQRAAPPARGSRLEREGSSMSFRGKASIVQDFAMKNSR